MRLPVAAIVLLTASVASAQSATLTFQNNTTELSFGPGRCGEETTLTWNLVTGTSVCGRMRLWVTPKTSCGDTPQEGEYELEDVAQAQLAQGTGTVQIEHDRLPFAAVAGDPKPTCQSPDREIDFRVCGSIETTSGIGLACDPRSISNGPTLAFDSKKPNPPQIRDVGPGDKKLTVNMLVDEEDTTTVRVEYRRQDATDDRWEPGGETGGDAATVTLNDLENEVIYLVRAFATDEVGNQSDSSNVVEAKPVETAGLFRAYVDAGGKEEGGCTAGALALVPGVVLVLGMTLLRRRTR